MPYERRSRGRYGARRDAAPTRELPASEEAEHHVLACCLLDGSDTIARALAAGITALSFYWPANQKLFERIEELYRISPPVTIEMLVEDLKTRRELDAAGGLDHLVRVTGNIPTTAHAGYFIEKVREKELLRKVVKEATAIVEGAYSYAGGGLGDYAEFSGPLQELEAIKARGGRQLPAILRATDFLPKEQSALPGELVKGVLHRGAKMMVAGGSKSFKTWVLLDLGLSVATGTPWWGMATIQGRVLYVNLELMQQFCEQRVRSIIKAKHMPSVPEMFDSWHLRGYARDFKELLPQFLAAMGGAKFSLIILDPVYKILGERDENANGEVAQLLNEFESLAVRTGAAVAYGHHHSKGNQSEKDARDRSSGAGAWTRDPDALVDLTPHEEQDHFVATFTLRNHPAKAPIVVEWEFPCMSVAPGMDPAKLKGPGRTPKFGVKDIVTPLMARSGGMRYGEWERDAVARGISESTFKRLVRRAEEEGRVRNQMGIWFFVEVGNGKAAA